VTQRDRDNGYEYAVLATRVGSEVLIGVATGGAAAALSKGSKGAQIAGAGIVAYDTLGNSINVGRGMGDMIENGVTWGNSAQTLGGAFGAGGNMLGTLGDGARALDDIADAAGDMGRGAGNTAGAAGDAARAADVAPPSKLHQIGQAADEAVGDAGCFVAGTPVLLSAIVSES